MSTTNITQYQMTLDLPVETQPLNQTESEHCPSDQETTRSNNTLPNKVSIFQSSKAFVIKNKKPIIIATSIIALTVILAVGCYYAYSYYSLSNKLPIDPGGIKVNETWVNYPVEGASTPAPHILTSPVSTNRAQTTLQRFYAHFQPSTQTTLEPVSSKIASELFTQNCRPTQLVSSSCKKAHEYACHGMEHILGKVTRSELHYSPAQHLKWAKVHVKRKWL